MLGERLGDWEGVGHMKQWIDLADHGCLREQGRSMLRPYSVQWLGQRRDSCGGEATP